MTKKEIIDKLSEYLNPHRWEHSIRVMKCARELALLYNVDKNKAALAGLLHDCAKGFKEDELIQKSMEYGLELDTISQHHKSLIHGPLGAEIAKDVFGVNDIEILSAIKYHTYGKENMTLLEKIIYLADLVEPNRQFKGIEKLRELARIDIDAAVLLALNDSIVALISKESIIHPNAIKARNYLIKQLNYNK